MTHPRADARRRHVLRCVSYWQEQLRSLAIEMQDLAVNIDETDETPAYWIQKTADDVLKAVKNLDRVDDDVRLTQRVS